MRALLRRLLPAAAYDRLAATWDRLRRFHPERTRREHQHRALQAGLPFGARSGDRMALRPGLVLALDPEAREPFEHFCFRSLDMARELDEFLAARARFERLLDVGALHGIFSLAFTAGRPAAQALAIDPSPLAQRVLAVNLALNPECRVEALPLALGASPGTVTMRWQWQHLEAVAGEGSDTDGAVVTVPQTTLDALCGERGFTPDLLKIDVEGYELAVLAGASAVLASARPTIFLELHPQRLRELGGSAEAVAARLASLGYRLRPIGGGTLAAALRRGRVFRLVAEPSV